MVHARTKRVDIAGKPESASTDSSGDAIFDGAESGLCCALLRSLAEAGFGFLQLPLQLHDSPDIGRTNVIVDRPEMLDEITVLVGDVIAIENIRVSESVSGRNDKMFPLFVGRNI